jgi:hypothetical protein
MEHRVLVHAPQVERSPLGIGAFAGGGAMSQVVRASLFQGSPLCRDELKMP